MARRNCGLLCKIRASARNKSSGEINPSPSLKEGGEGRQRERQREGETERSRERGRETDRIEAGGWEEQTYQ
jgi:hypothetical protein